MNMIMKISTAPKSNINRTDGNHLPFHEKIKKEYHSPVITPGA